MRARAALAAVWVALAAVLALAAPGACAELPDAGDTLAPFPIVAPPAQADRDYLGLGGGETFTLADVKAELIVLEFSGVYCPICHEQAPGVRSLFKRLQRAGLSGRVKLFSVAGGSTQMEVDQVHGLYKAEYPILCDPDFAVHAALNEPKTPFTMVLRPDGSVLWAHLGRIDDFDGFFKTIQSLL
jgi:peroxiredoxin